MLMESKSVLPYTAQKIAEGKKGDSKETKVSTSSFIDLAGVDMINRYQEDTAYLNLDIPRLISFWTHNQLKVLKFRELWLEDPSHIETLTKFIFSRKKNDVLPKKVVCRSEQPIPSSFLEAILSWSMISNIRVLHVEHQRALRTLMTPLTSMFSNNKTLKEVRLVNVDFTDSEVRKLSPSWAKHPTLETLILDNNVITDQGLQTLFDALTSSERTQPLTVYLRDNLISQKKQHFIKSKTARLPNLQIVLEGSYSLENIQSAITELNITLRQAQYEMKLLMEYKVQKQYKRYEALVKAFSPKARSSILGGYTLLNNEMPKATRVLADQLQAEFTMLNVKVANQIGVAFNPWLDAVNKVISYHQLLDIRRQKIKNVLRPSAQLPIRFTSQNDRLRDQYDAFDKEYKQFSSDFQRNQLKVLKERGEKLLEEWGDLRAPLPKGHHYDPRISRGAHKKLHKTQKKTVFYLLIRLMGLLLLDSEKIDQKEIESISKKLDNSTSHMKHKVKMAEIPQDLDVIHKKLKRREKELMAYREELWRFRRFCNNREQLGAFGTLCKELWTDEYEKFNSDILSAISDKIKKKVDVRYSLAPFQIKKINGELEDILALFETIIPEKRSALFEGATQCLNRHKLKTHHLKEYPLEAYALVKQTAQFDKKQKEFKSQEEKHQLFQRQLKAVDEDKLSGNFTKTVCEQKIRGLEEKLAKSKTVLQQKLSRNEFQDLERLGQESHRLNTELAQWKKYRDYLKAKAEYQQVEAHLNQLAADMKQEKSAVEALRTTCATKLEQAAKSMPTRIPHFFKKTDSAEEKYVHFEYTQTITALDSKATYAKHAEMKRRSSYRAPEKSRAAFFSATEPALPSVRGEYTVDFKASIGQGKVSTVYRGQWYGRAIAVKALKAKYTKAEKDQFVKEIGLLAQCRHPNIISPCGVDLESKNPCFILPEEQSLQAFFETKMAINPTDQKQIALELAYALSYLHDHHIIHRNLKPSSILLTKDLHVKIAGFSLAKKTYEDSKATTFRHTATAWLAPESLSFSSYTEKSDLYSFGMILWSLVTGKIPYDGMTNAALIKHIRSGKRVEIPSYIPTFYADLIQDCCNPDPVKRPTLKYLINSLRHYQPRPPSLSAEERYLLGCKEEVARRYTSAVAHFEKARKQGSFRASTALAICHLRGRGVPTPNKLYAYQLLLHGEKNKYNRAIFTLACMLELGDGVPQDIPGAIHRFQYLADHKNVHQKAAKRKLNELQQINRVRRR